jgi:uncharacterized membrane protein
MLGCGLMGGVFFAFSAFVMNALANLATAQGIAAMQSINRSAIRPTFMIALFGTALTCAAVGVRSVIAWGQPGAAWALAGATLYLAGSSRRTIRSRCRRRARGRLPCLLSPGAPPPASRRIAAARQPSL